MGSHVWVEDTVLAWIDGEVFKVDGNEIHVHTTNGKTVSMQSTTFFILSLYQTSEKFVVPIEMCALQLNLSTR